MIPAPGPFEARHVGVCQLRCRMCVSVCLWESDVWWRDGWWLLAAQSEGVFSHILYIYERFSVFMCTVVFCMPMQFLTFCSSRFCSPKCKRHCLHHDRGPINLFRTSQRLFHKKSNCLFQPKTYITIVMLRTTSNFLHSQRRVLHTTHAMSLLQSDSLLTNTAVNPLQGLVRWYIAADFAVLWRNRLLVPFRK